MNEVVRTTLIEVVEGTSCLVQFLVPRRDAAKACVSRTGKACIESASKGSMSVNGSVVGSVAPGNPLISDSHPEGSVEIVFTSSKGDVEKKTTTLSGTGQTLVSFGSAAQESKIVGVRFRNSSAIKTDGSLLVGSSVSPLSRGSVLMTERVKVSDWNAAYDAATALAQKSASAVPGVSNFSFSGSTQG